MITTQALINQSKPGGQEPTNPQRRAFMGGALAALPALSALLSSSTPVRAEETPGRPHDPFILLLHGVYQPVVHAPNFGLKLVDLDDGSYSTTEIYPIFGIHGSTDQDDTVGDFFVQATLAQGKITFNGLLCAYHLRGGALTMQFDLATSAGFTKLVPDGMGGQFLEGTFELTILEATGIFAPFKGGHNHMVDKLHQLADGSFDELCFCIISVGSVL
jgi:hypothetical protein